MVDKEFVKKVRDYGKIFSELREEMANIVVGQSTIVDALLRAIIANGHALLEGVPGIAKTLMIRTLSSVTKCSFKRIQFTPDLLPTDIVGITAYDEKKGFYIVKGPIFANFILADEINRAPPKVQSALLEAMQEKQVTIGKETFDLEHPFFVFATQNPLESMGTYPLPEAQMDRFLFKIYVDYPTVEDEQEILMKNMTLKRFTEYKLKPLLSPQAINILQKDVQNIYLDEKIEKYIVHIIDATRHPDKYKLKLAKYIEWGSSPRASIGLFIASKAEAMLKGKEFVTPQHIKEIAHDTLRHRIILNYEGQAEGIKTDDVITEILSRIPVP
ncbi:MoxR family ATPase [Candidatus Woesearchaeota archaeon]|nr:MoxR family ATPase [Candidatus Woesearchaeota archaeon]